MQVQKLKLHITWKENTGTSCNNKICLPNLIYWLKISFYPGNNAFSSTTQPMLKKKEQKTKNNLGFKLKRDPCLLIVIIKIG